MVSMRKYLRLATAVMAVMAALAVVSCNSWSPVQETDASKYELKGDVLSLRSIPYTVDSAAEGFKAGEIDPMANNVYIEFNSDGNATLLRRFNRHGDMVSEQRSLYNSKGQLLETETVSSSGELLEKAVYEYKNGRIYSMRATDGMDSLKKYEVYKYYGTDSIRVDYSFKEDKPAGYRIMTYDDRGYNTGNIMYSVTGRKLSEFKMRYDSQCRRDSVYSDNMLFGKMESRMEYDDNGFCSAMTISGRANTVSIHFELTLDSHGNWIERLTYQDGSAVPTKIERREIRYAD